MPCLPLIPLQLSKGLGNQKPQALLKIERLIWQSVIKITTGESPLVPEVMQLASTVRTQATDSMDWFPPATIVPESRERYVRISEILRSVEAASVWLDQGSGKFAAGIDSILL